MAKPLRLAGLLLVTSALTAPAFAQAPADQESDAVAPADAADAADDTPADVSIPGGGGTIVVVGRRNANLERNSTAVVSVLSTEDIARTGEGDIAGSLGHVTGLSVVGNGFVYVRGLGDRYSLALLNGSPLPSPEPLKRVVPLDVFPTNIIASSLVQKSYSPNFPGEFGGGVINLTTLAVPRETFLEVSGGITLDSETTGRLSYTYTGADTDWTGFDNGSRNWPTQLTDFIKSGKSLDEVDSSLIGATFINSRNAVVLADHDTRANTSAGITFGTSMPLGSADFGIIATAGYSNKYRTRDNLQQKTLDPLLENTIDDFRTVISDNRIVVNGLLGLGLEFDSSKMRWTNLFIRDTLKYASLGEGTKNVSQAGQDFIDQKTAWYERQLIDTQFTGEFRLGDFTLELRGGYANSQREAPYEIDIEYARKNQGGLYDSYYVNEIGGQGASPTTVAFSDLSEDLWSGGIDLSYPIASGLSATIGYAYSDTQREAARYEYQFRRQFTPDDNPDLYKQIGLLRPDLLFAPGLVNSDTGFNIGLNDNDPNNHVFEAKLRVHGVYGKIVADLTDGLNLDAGVRFEHGVEETAAIDPGSNTPATRLKRQYLLPAATLTYSFGDGMQLRLNASKTIARPQFRELIFQNFYDAESNRTFKGNPFLTDSQLYNGEVRYEWYFGRSQHLMASAFYKRIDKPIEPYASPLGDNAIYQSFANAPKADLYGAEFEFQKNFDLFDVAEGSDFWESRRLVLTANYTWTKSKVKVQEGDTVILFSGSGTQQPTEALNVFVDGKPLIGQSDHIVNFEISLEDENSLSQQTLIFTYASDRVTQRGTSGLPDLIEQPGMQLDFVARQGITLFGVAAELKAQVRNILGHTYKEFQTNGTNTIYANRYKQGTMASASISVKF